MIEDWNARYTATEEHDREPAPLLVDAVRDVPPGRALDLACGAGRNAVWLAEQGWDVVGVDGSSEALRLLRERDPHIPTHLLDLETGAPLPFGDASFDLVAILYYLHRPLFAEAQRVVKPGGLIVSAALMTGRFAVAPGEVAQQLNQCEVLLLREGEVAEIIARRL
jgi:tellurite methyltransferase